MKNFLFLISAVALYISSCSQIEDSVIPEGAEDLYVLATTAGNAHLISNGMDLDGINAVIASTLPGDTVWVESGTYIIDGALSLKPGIHILKKDSQNPIFNARWKTTALHQQDWTLASCYTSISIQAHIHI